MEIDKPTSVFLRRQSRTCMVSVLKRWHLINGIVLLSVNERLFNYTNNRTSNTALVIKKLQPCGGRSSMFFLYDQRFHAHMTFLCKKFI